ncbi:hypothetical protein D9M68_609100 [compost metagenome]
MRGQLVVAGHVLDVPELVLGGHLGDRQQLDAVLLAVWRVHEKVPEIARPLAVLERLAQLVDVLLLLRGVGHVKDEAGVAAILIVAPPEERGRLVEPGGIERRQVFRQPVHLLVNVRLQQVKDAARLEGVLVLPGLHKMVGLQVHAAAHVFGHGRLQSDRLAQQVVTPLQVAVAEHQEVLYPARECRARQQFVRNEGRDQDVALHVNGRAIVHGRAEAARQPIPRQRRLVPVAHAHALHIVEQLTAVEHGNWIAEAECLDRRRGGSRRRAGIDMVCNSRLAARLLAGHENSMMLVLVVVTPSIGSWASACMHAQARSAWLVSSERPAW